MEESGQEFTGKSVDEAVAEGLSRLGLRREQVDVEILSRGSRGIFGLGSEPARVRIARVAPKSEPKRPEPRQPEPKQPELKQPEPWQPEAPRSEPPARVEAEAAPRSVKAPETLPVPAPVPAPAISVPVNDAVNDVADDTLDGAGDDLPALSLDRDQLAAMSIEVLSEIIKHMGFDADVVASWRNSDPGSEPEDESDLGEDSDTEGYLLLDIQGDDVSALIGRRGETLASIQYLVRLIINQRLRQWKNIVVDVEQYKERRVAQLTQLAQRMADQVVQSGRAMSLEPMPPNERRIVHLALRDHASVYTQSSGEGDRRKVHIVAKS